MRLGMKMMAYNALKDNTRSRDNGRMNYGENEYNTNRTEYNGSGMNYGGVEGRFRDRRGREHYDDGRFAPMNEMGDMENRRDRMGRYTSNMEMHSPYVSPVYERPMNQIGFNREMDSNYRMDAGYSRMNEMDNRGSEMQKGGASGHAVKLDERMAEEWMSNLKTDGQRGPHWSKEQIKQAMAQRGLRGDPTEMWVAMNTVYSDLSKVLKRHNVSSLDAYIDIATAFWLDDEDAMPDKLARYEQNIVKH